MVRADTQSVKVHLKQNEEDYIIIAESVEAVQEWKKDSSKPLVDVVESFDVFSTNKHGTQGQLNRASKAQLDNDFGTSDENEIVKKILESGSVQEQKGPGRQGQTNITNGPGAGNIA